MHKEPSPCPLCGHKPSRPSKILSVMVWGLLLLTLLALISSALFGHDPDI